MSRFRRPMVQLNIAVALFGLSGLLGKATTASPLCIVAGRTVFGALAFAVLFLTGVLKWPDVPAHRYLRLAWPGCVLAVHWVCFFQAIQVSSVAVALLAYSSFPVFTTLFEPIVFRESRRRVDLLTAGLVLLGVAILVPSFDLNNNTTAGICWGVLSGLTFAILLMMNRGLAIQFPPAVIAAGQSAFAALVLLLFLPAYYRPLTPTDWLLLVILGVVFTALAHFLFIDSLRSVRAQYTSIVSALEPVYGSLFAWALLGEIPTARTIGGGTLIIAAVLVGAVSQADQDPTGDVEEQPAVGH